MIPVVILAVVGKREKFVLLAELTFLFPEREEEEWVNMCWGSVSLGKA